MAIAQFQEKIWTKLNTGKSQRKIPFNLLKSWRLELDNSIITIQITCERYFTNLIRKVYGCMYNTVKKDAKMKREQ